MKYLENYIEENINQEGFGDFLGRIGDALATVTDIFARLLDAISYILEAISKVYGLSMEQVDKLIKLCSNKEGLQEILKVVMKYTSLAIGTAVGLAVAIFIYKKIQEYRDPCLKLEKPMDRKKCMIKHVETLINDLEEEKRKLNRGSIGYDELVEKLDAKILALKVRRIKLDTLVD